MIFHIGIFLWSVAFFLGTKFVAAQQYGSFWGGYAFSIALLSVLALVSANKITKHLRNSFLPLFLAFSMPSLLLLVDSPTEKTIVAFIGAGMYYLGFLALYRIRHAPTDRTARSFLSISMLSVLFFFYSAAFGFYLNFAVPLWTLTLVFGIGSFGAAYQTLSASLRGDRKRVALYSFAIAFGTAEISWLISFWPFGYLTAGAAMLLFFYIPWDMANSLFLGTLSRKRTVQYLLVTVLLLGLLLWSAPWRLQV
ncbi:MAG: hypothetical protein HGA31_03240 [Candidatus Moranbacteria bacterium]|nr:hypothetical protein [Candidatus Moranbacteria bacterium]